MKFNSFPELKEEVYNKQLHEIADIKFTRREIDVIACILHNRGEKKIATLLQDISYRTVGAHARNIMNKLGCNSKDFIIDFIEKSGKLQDVRQYYFYLVVESSFIKILQKISKLINRSAVHCSIDLSESADQSTDKQLKQIKEYLYWANIILIDRFEEKGAGDIAVNLCVFSNDMATKKILHQNNKRNNHNKSHNRDIILVFDSNEDVLSLLKNTQYIDFVSTKNYYFSVLELVKKIIGVADIEKLIQEFQDEYQSLQASWKGTGFKQVTTGEKTKFTKRTIFFVVSVIIFISIIITTVFVARTKTSHNIVHINAELAGFVKVFSADSITTEEDKKRNYSLVRKVSKVVDSFYNKEVQDYFQSRNVTHDELVNCLYVFHALGTHYVYNEHDGIRARELLVIAKNIAEYYVTHQHNLQIDFDNLTPEEIYAELNIFKDLPEMYTKIIYLLGKTYMYQGDLEDSIKYLEISKYLWSKLCLFEGYLSIRSGTEIARRSRIEEDIRNGEYTRAQENLIQSIEVFTKLREDANEYKISYRPSNNNPQIIIPAKDAHNKLFIDEEIVKAYSRLVLISEHKQQKQVYATKILSKFVGSNSSPGMLAEAKKVIARRTSSTYNNLGNKLLQ